jgi:signal transduction histidine kinase
MEFTADASHELRTPLSVIEATTTLALSRDRDATWYRTAFVRVHAESGRIRRLVEDLLWLARFDATRGQPDAEPVDVAVLAEQAADRFTSLAEARGLSLSLDSGPEPAVVTAPPEWLDRLLGVLLDNACKYSGPSGTVEVVVRTEGNRVRLKVDDSGPGIPPEERKRIFDRFHRATQQSGGAGLGLAIADAVVRATNGRWNVGGSAAGGASMSVTWPRTLAGARVSARSGGGVAMPRPAPTPHGE